MQYLILLFEHCVLLCVLIVAQHITEATRLNYEQNMHDAIAVFPRLQTGLDVNVKFTGFVHVFCSTSRSQIAIMIHHTCCIFGGLLQIFFNQI